MFEKTCTLVQNAILSQFYVNQFTSFANSYKLEYSIEFSNSFEGKSANKMTANVSL